MFKIVSLRQAADNFYNNILKLIKDNNEVNMRTLNFGKMPKKIQDECTDVAGWLYDADWKLWYFVIYISMK